MARLRDRYEPLDDIEALIRSAGNFVQTSEDLRPRVLETARGQRVERWVQRCLQQVVFFVVLLGSFTTPVCYRSETAAIRPQGMLGAVDSQALFSQAEAASRRNDDMSWGMVDSFTALRRRQADILRLDLQ